MQTKVDLLAHDAKAIVDNTISRVQMKDIIFSQKKLETLVQKLEEKLGDVDQKLDLLLSFFLNQEDTDAKMGEKILKIKYSPTLTVHKKRDIEGDDRNKKTSYVILTTAMPNVTRAISKSQVKQSTQVSGAT